MSSLNPSVCVCNCDWGWIWANTMSESKFNWVEALVLLMGKTHHLWSQLWHSCYTPTCVQKLYNTTPTNQSLHAYLLQNKNTNLVSWQEHLLSFELLTNTQVLTCAGPHAKLYCEYLSLLKCVHLRSYVDAAAFKKTKDITISLFNNDYIEDQWITAQVNVPFSLRRCSSAKVCCK